MWRFKLLILGLALSACGTDPTDTCPPADPFPEQYFVHYDKMMLCSEISAEPPLWREVGSRPCGKDPSYWCLEGSSSMGAKYNRTCKTITVQKEHKPAWQIEHEIIHHLQRQAGKASGHCTKEFIKCAPTGEKCE